MVVKYSRAERRHHAARMKKRAKFIIETQWWFTNLEAYYEPGNKNHSAEQTANRMFNNMKVCSCYMCCNERRNPYTDNPLTMQEQKALDSYYDQLDDYFCGP